MKNSIKKVVALVLTLIMVLSIGAVTTFADDNAPVVDSNTQTTPADPKITPTADFAPVGTETVGDKVLKVWEIKNEADFLAFFDETTRNANGKASYANSIVRLCADIDLNPTWDASTKTTPVNYLSKSLFYMKCTFDGQGHTVKGACVIVEGADNANLVVLSEGQTTFNNLNIENSYFSARPKVVDGELKSGSGAAIVSAARFGVWFNNVSVDAVCEAQNGNAAGFVSAFSCSSATATPVININNCIFTGEVYGTTAAGGFVGTNDRPATQKGKGTYTVTLIDCANYGKVTSTTPNTAGGLVGVLANKGVFTRCYSAGNCATALFNVAKSASENLEGVAITADLTDCYYAASAGVLATTATADAVTTVTYKYGETTEEAAKTATPAELVTFDAFKKTDDFAGWIVNSTGAVPAIFGCTPTTHDFVAGTPVAPDQCKTDGYTLYTCSKCGTTKQDDIVAKAEHTYVKTPVAPTCTEKGYDEHKCSVCGDTYKENEVAALGHTEGEWVIAKPADTEKAGSKYLECSVCKGAIKNEIIPKLEAETEADTTASENEAETEAEEGGCGSSIALGGMVLMSTVLSLGVATVSKKRK